MGEPQECRLGVYWDLLKSVSQPPLPFPQHQGKQQEKGQFNHSCLPVLA